MNTNLEKLFSVFYSSINVRPSGDDYFKTRPGEITNVLTLFNIKSLFDAGCRNRDWISQIYFNSMGVEYIGGDISKDMVDYCNKHYPEYTITHYDCTTDDSPEVDCVLISDVLIHLSIDDKIKFLKKFVSSNSKLLLMTNSSHDHNDEISMTGPHNDFPFAHVNWELEPWSFPKPIYTIPSHRLSLWTRDQLKNIVDKL